MKIRKILGTIVILLCILLYFLDSQNINNYVKKIFSDDVSYKINNIPDYTNQKYIIINDNKPNFSKKYMNANSFEKYSNLDELGRCGKAFANISIEMMPSKERESIGMIKPSGWKISKYDFIDGEYLFNRCHLIAYMLTGQNANEKNLITCTRQMNSIVMLDFELQVANYIRKTKNHVLYRVTPIFEGDNLLAKGVQMEALSIEDDGEGIKFNVFVYNVQDNIDIDYTNGDNRLID